MNLSRLLLVACYTGLCVLGRCRALRIFFGEDDFVQLDNRMISIVHLRGYGFGGILNGDYAVFMNLPRRLFDRFIKQCVNASRQMFVFREYLAQAQLGEHSLEERNELLNYILSNQERFIEFGESQNADISMANEHRGGNEMEDENMNYLYGSEFDDSEEMSNDDWYEIIEQMLEVYGSDAFQWVFPAIIKEQLELAPTPLRTSTRSKVTAIVKFTREIRDYAKNQRVQPESIPRGRFCYKEIVFTSEVDQLLQCTRYNLSEMMCFLEAFHNVEQLTRYYALVINNSGRLMGYMIDNSAFGSIDSFLEMHSTTLNSDLFLIDQLFMLARAIDQMHSAGVVNRAINAHNVFVDKIDVTSDIMDGNYYFKIGEMTWAALEAEESQYKFHNRRPYFLPMEMEHVSLKKYSCQPSVDWYEYGYLLSKTCEKISQKCNDEWILRIFSPLIAGLTVNNPQERFSYLNIVSYFELLMNPEQEACIQRNEIITTLTYENSNALDLNLFDPLLQMKRIYVFRDEKNYFFLVRSQIGAIERVQFDIIVQSANGERESKREQFISQPIAPYFLGVFPPECQCTMASNLTFNKKKSYGSDDYFRIDCNWQAVQLCFCERLNQSHTACCLFGDSVNSVVEIVYNACEQARRNRDKFRRQVLFNSALML